MTYTLPRPTIETFKELWRKHIVDGVNPKYHEQCFMCNKGSCDGCPYYELKEENDQNV